MIKQAANDDNIAVEIMDEGKHYLRTLIEKIASFHPKRFSMIGGLAPHWAERLEHNIQCQLRPSLCTPEYGAVALAKKTFKDA